MTFNDLQRIRQWHVEHHQDHPLEQQLWDWVLAVWMVGWVGWLPAYALDALWATPLCLAAMLLPDAYVAWRRRAHRALRLRCDWLQR
jgi:hypothetical protein